MDHITSSLEGELRATWIYHIPIQINFHQGPGSDQGVGHAERVDEEVVCTRDPEGEMTIYQFIPFES